MSNGRSSTRFSLGVHVSSVRSLDPRLYYARKVVSATRCKWEILWKLIRNEKENRKNRPKKKEVLVFFSPLPMLMVFAKKWTLSSLFFVYILSLQLFAIRIYCSPPPCRYIRVKCTETPFYFVSRRRCSGNRLHFSNGEKFKIKILLQLLRRYSFRIGWTPPVRKIAGGRQYCGNGWSSPRHLGIVSPMRQGDKTICCVRYAVCSGRQVAFWFVIAFGTIHCGIQYLYWVSSKKIEWNTCNCFLSRGDAKSERGVRWCILAGECLK